MMPVYVGVAIKPLLEKENRAYLLDDWHLRRLLTSSKREQLATESAAAHEIKKHLDYAAYRWLTSEAYDAYTSWLYPGVTSFAVMSQLNRPDLCIFGRSTFCSIDDIAASRMSLYLRMKDSGFDTTAMLIRDGYAYLCLDTTQPGEQPVLHFEPASRDIYLSQPRN